MFIAQLAGRLTADPQIVGANRNVVRFGLADNRRWTDALGNEHEETTFADVVVFDETTGRNVVASLHKGDFVHVEASMRANDLTTQAEETDEAGAPTGRIVVTNRKGYSFVARSVSPDLRFQSAPVAKNQRQDQPAAAATPAPVENVQEALV